MDSSLSHHDKQGYQILNLLGRGGFAHVYKAKAVSTGQEVAIKIIDKLQMKTAGLSNRLQKEVEIHTQLSHPAILEMYSCFEDDASVYLVLEFCPGGPLYDRVHGQKEGGVGEEQAAAYLAQVASGLAYLHSHGVLHRDVSLGNVLLTEDNIVKIADFGLATRLSEDDEKQFTLCGTPNYMSPEVATRSGHGAQSDLWSLGCMLYTLLVGTPPFDCEGSVMDTLRRAITSSCHIPDHLSAEAKHLIKGLLQKNPRQRMTIDDVLNHPFLKKYATSTSLNTRAMPNTSFPSRQVPKNMNSLIVDHTPVKRMTQGPESVSKRRRQNPASYQNEILIQQKPSETQGSFDYSSQSSTDYVGGCTTDKPHHYLAPASRSASPGSDITDCHVTAISSARLRPIRHQQRNVVASILDDGFIVLEMTKPVDGIQKVHEVMRISPDGQLVQVFQPDVGQDIVNSEPASPATPSTVREFHYTELPPRYQKRYLYAARFIKLVQSKTPKITLYTEGAKNMLMENSPNPDFETMFFEGGRVQFLGDVTRITTSDGQRATVTSRTVNNLPSNARNQLEYAQQCRQKCMELESVLTSVHSNSSGASSPFPVTLGSRPSTLPAASFGDYED